MENIKRMKSNEVSIAPRAIDIMNTTRFMGYTTEAAVSDILDNSISAFATEIDVDFDPEKLCLSITDNGCGMNFDELKDALRYGKSPSMHREDTDLGRFGLGLKTASFSQCNILTVISKKESQINGLKWDPYYIEENNCEWTALKLSKEELSNRLKNSSLNNYSSGTMVIWDDLSLMLAGESNPTKALSLKMDSVRQHVQLVFHRFLSGEKDLPKVDIKFNQTSIKPRDPFLTKKSHLISEDQVIPIDLPDKSIADVRIRRYQLPEPSKISKEDMKNLCGDGTLSNTQGFYVYRNKRLLVSGTWFRLAPKTNRTKLCRIMIDIPSSMDQLWALDVKKSTARPPEIIRKNLKGLIDFSQNNSKKIFNSKAVIESNPGIVHFWKKTIDKEGTITYEINAEHPLIHDFESNCSDIQKSQFNKILKQVSQMLPLNQLYADMDDDLAIGLVDENNIEKEISEDFETLLRHATDKTKIAKYCKTEPFSRYPELISELLEKNGINI